jgi:tRNA A-37 threonylcarbamoyl transferase component Bud32
VTDALASVALAAPGSLPSGARLGRYQIIRRLAKGGMAELYLSRQIGGGGYEKVVALKRVLPHLAEDLTFVRMFLNEAKIAAGLDHSNIVHVVDFGSEGGEHFMVMEYVHGRSVLDLLRQSARVGGLPLPCALTIAGEVAAALHYAHERAGSDGRPLGLVHRDVSPSNVLVSFEGDVKLVDFGIAKATAHTRVTRSGAIKGKLSYMAPEQVRGEAVDRRADVFALCVVTYELCTGQRCFVAPGEFALINRVAAGRYERPTSIDPTFPRALEAIIARGLAVDPAGRFHTARELQLAIEEFAASHGHRLSKVALSERMHALFGDEAYPTTSTLPPLDSTVAKVGRADVATEPIARKGRGTLLLAGGALVAGLLLGIGGPRLYAALSGDTEDASAGDGSGSGAQDEATLKAGPAAPVASDPPQDEGVAHDTDMQAEDAIEMVIDDGGSAAAPRDRPRPRRTTKKRSKAGGSREPAPPPKPKASREYLPPSRRGG